MRLIVAKLWQLRRSRSWYFLRPVTCATFAVADQRHALGGEGKPYSHSIVQTVSNQLKLLSNLFWWRANSDAEAVKKLRF